MEELDAACEAAGLPLLEYDQEEGDTVFVGMAAAHMVSNLASNIKVGSGGRAS